MVTVESRSCEQFAETRLLTFMAWTVLGLLFPIGALFAMRRVIGGIQSPLSPLALLLVVVVLCGLSLWLRHFDWTMNSLDDEQRFSLALRWIVPAIPLWLLMSVTSLPGTVDVALFIAWTVFLAVEIFTAWRLWQTWQATIPRVVADTVHRRGDIDVAHRVALAESTAIKNPKSADPEETENDQKSAALLPDEATQQITRYQEVDGTDAIHGMLRTVVPPGEKMANLHVAFCPPFSRVPVVFAELLVGNASSVKPALVMPYGVRIDLRLASVSDEPQTVVVEFHASANESDDQTE